MHQTTATPNSLFTHIFLCPPLYKPRTLADDAPQPPKQLSSPVPQPDGSFFSHNQVPPNMRTHDLCFRNCNQVGDTIKLHFDSVVHLDGSAKANKRGSAFWVFHGSWEHGYPGCALAIPSPYATCSDTEFLALLCFLRRHDWGSHTVLIFSDNKQLVDTINALHLFTGGPTRSWEPQSRRNRKMHWTLPHIDPTNLNQPRERQGLLSTISSPNTSSGTFSPLYG